MGPDGFAFNTDKSKKQILGVRSFERGGVFVTTGSGTYRVDFDHPIPYREDCDYFGLVEEIVTNSGSDDLALVKGFSFSRDDYDRDLLSCTIELYSSVQTVSVAIAVLEIYNGYHA